MKMKLTTLLFGLLLAVGWTSNASAQRLADQPHNFMYLGKWTAEMTDNDIEQTIKADVPETSRDNVAPRRAPLRASYTVKADVVHPKSWYTPKTYKWYDLSGHENEASFTDVVTDSCQMYWFTRALYTNAAIPGIKYAETQKDDVIYRGNDFGYFVSGPVTEDCIISMNTYVQINCITVYDLEGNVISKLDANNYSTTPNGWTIHSYSDLSNTRQYDYTTRNYYWAFDESNTTTSSYKAFTISSSILQNYDGVQIVVRARQTKSSTPTRDYTYNIWRDPVNRYAGEKHLLKSTWDDYHTMYTFPITTPPTENGYSIVLVKLSGKVDPMTKRPTERTFSTEELYSYFGQYIGEMQLLTDGLRVGEGSSTAGTVFAYSGILDKFFLIGKGKTYPIATPYACSENYWTTDDDDEYVRHSDRAPFYSMYEEFSPDVASSTSNITDLYSEMHGGQYYPVLHDCQSVMYLRHYFSMEGKDKVAPKSVAPLVFYIPDWRGDSIKKSRVYEEEHRPQLGLYQINLSAETEPVADYSDPDNRNYIVYLDWTSTLNQMVNNTVDQTYVIYTVTYDANNNPEYHYLATVENETTYDYIVPQQQTSQQIEYVIMGYPTGATNNPDPNNGGIEGGIFFTYSDPDDVQIPGWFDFMVLYRERYESDFVIKEEKNYYRNYLYPTNLAPGTGMTMEQLKKEWPNQTASYTLWRDNLGIAKLEVRAIGDKVYYRIRYYKDTQVTTGPNANGTLDDNNSGNAKMPFNYVEIPNE